MVPPLLLREGVVQLACDKELRVHARRSCDARPRQTLQRGGQEENRVKGWRSQGTPQPPPVRISGTAKCHLSRRALVK
ncbi:hypothetical protein BDZ91DRAFT_746995 [Kalaharituber pfeilii]|nr:hypothetical protein BDZ91DRAFT_746995 [Kalaharituber pfeilii]